jgi:hypothetical protein
LKRTHRLGLKILKFSKYFGTFDLQVLALHFRNNTLFGFEDLFWFVDFSFYKFFSACADLGETEPGTDKEEPTEYKNY